MLLKLVCPYKNIRDIQNFLEYPPILKKVQYHLLLPIYQLHFTASYRCDIHRIDDAASPYKIKIVRKHWHNIRKQHRAFKFFVYTVYNCFVSVTLQINDAGRRNIVSLLSTLDSNRRHCFIHRKGLTDKKSGQQISGFAIISFVVDHRFT